MPTSPAPHPTCSPPHLLPAPPAPRRRPPVDKSQQPRMSLCSSRHLSNPLDVLRVSPVRGLSHSELPGASLAPKTAAVQGRPSVSPLPVSGSSDSKSALLCLSPGFGSMSLRVWLQGVNFRYQNMNMFSFRPLIGLGDPLRPHFRCFDFSCHNLHLQSRLSFPQCDPFIFFSLLFMDEPL